MKVEKSLYEKLKEKAENFIKNQYIPEPNTINDLVEKLPKEMLRKNNGCYVSNKIYEDKKEIWRKDKWMWKM